MRSILSVSVLALTFFASVPAWAENLSNARDFYKACQKSSTLTRQDKLAGEALIENTACVFFFKGWMEGFLVHQNVMTEIGFKPTVCFPREVSLRQGMTDVINYISRNPIEPTLSTAMVSMYVFAEQFPCKDARTAHPPRQR